MTERAYFPINDLRELMDSEFVKKKINCIKHLRAMTGEGLKETKDFYEQEWLPFINGARTPPREIKTYISETPEFEHLRKQVQNLSDEVADLRSMNTRSRAATIFNDEE